MLSERFKLRLKYAYDMLIPTFFYGCFPSYKLTLQKKKQTIETKLINNDEGKCLKEEIWSYSSL